MQFSYDFVESNLCTTGRWLTAIKYLVVNFVRTLSMISYIHSMDL